MSCHHSKETVDPIAQSSPRFIHNVYFYFHKDSLDLQLAADFPNGLAELSTIPTILKAQYGPPTMTPREVVDNTYAFAYLVEFASKEDHDVYQDHPVHKAFIEKYQSLWKEVKVYDNFVINK